MKPQIFHPGVCLLLQEIFILVLHVSNQIRGNELESDCLMKSKFYGAKNRTLKNFMYGRKEGIYSYVQCGRDCYIDSKCVSLNYNLKKNVCELNFATRVQHTSNFVEDSESVYFDTNKDTPFDALMLREWYMGTPLHTATDTSPHPATNTLSRAATDIPILSEPRYSSCLEALHNGHRDSGVYQIFPPLISDGLEVYCDMETDGGGWIVFQRRQNGSVNFYKYWDDYQAGFGQLSGEFWLGNENLRSLTTGVSTKWELRVDLEDWDGNTAWAEYQEFAVTGTRYKLHCTSYNSNSTVGDSLSSTHNGRAFTTRDQDNDPRVVGNCAKMFHGAWWYKSCLSSCLNGEYYQRAEAASVDQGIGVHWRKMRGNRYSLKGCSMKIRDYM